MTNTLESGIVDHDDFEEDFEEDGDDLLTEAERLSRESDDCESDDRNYLSSIWEVAA